MDDTQRLIELMNEVTRFLAAALAVEERHEADLQRRDELHIAETARRDELHIAETARRDELHAQEMELFRDALETRDLIGQAKGVIMAALACTPDEAFRLIRAQSQHENRKVVEIAAEIARRATAGTSRPNAADSA